MRTGWEVRETALTMHGGSTAGLTARPDTAATDAGGGPVPGSHTYEEFAMRKPITTLLAVGGGTPFFTALDNWVKLSLIETRMFPDGVVLTRYETRH